MHARADRPFFFFFFFFLLLITRPQNQLFRSWPQQAFGGLSWKRPNCPGFFKTPVFDVKSMAFVQYQGVSPTPPDYNAIYNHLGTL